MRRGVWLVFILLLAAPVAAAPPDEDGPVLRHWFVGLESLGTRRQDFSVFGRDDLPGGAVREHGAGAGLVVGHRFGDRFLLGLQLTAAEHQLDAEADRLLDLTLLFTGTVLFREQFTLQPFLRGGFGAGGELLEYPDQRGNVDSYGTAAIAGAGLQLRLSSRFSLDLETLAVVTNFLEARDESHVLPGAEDQWQVRDSNWGWRLGVGLMAWF